jgi:LAO/AO transport system kinase
MSQSLDSVEDYRSAILKGDRRAMARAITHLESTLEVEAALGQAILESVVGETGGAARIGVTGSPGVGKSTFIEALGLHLIEQGHRVAVLAVDPSSPVTGGSILGDKTRMERLTLQEDAFIRPSPSSGSLGGVAQRTREAMLICEAAGYDVVLIETVGIGQSEVKVASRVEFFLVLLLPGGGDELQGIKRGVMELADALVVNKSDGDAVATAQRTVTEYRSALELIRSRGPSWDPVAMMASALQGEGILEVRDTIFEHRTRLTQSGELEDRRRDQARAWMWSLVEEGLQAAFRGNARVAREISSLEERVQQLEMTPAAAARCLLTAFQDH